MIPFYLWGFGANSIGFSFGADRVRCTECRRWTRIAAFFELGRVLCNKCHVLRGEVALSWLARAA